jgi:class II lanthipeptide synthase
MQGRADGEVAWATFAQLVVNESLGLELRKPRIIGLEQFTVVEFVSHECCRDQDSVCRCFRRYGALLALAHSIGAYDLHHENLIVAGEHPIVVDAEAFFRAPLVLSKRGERRLEFETHLSLKGLDARESLLDLGLLPITIRLPLFGEIAEWQELEIGALCAYGEQPIMQIVPCGRDSDNLQMRPIPVIADQFPNLPIWVDRYSTRMRF